MSALARLIPQLSATIEVPNREQIEQMLLSRDVNLFVVELDGEIVGIASIIIYTVPSGKKGYIEDVVIDPKVRGRGLGSQLIQYLISYAKQQQVSKIDLSSNPSRKSAHALYESCGFLKRDTFVYRLNIE